MTLILPNRMIGKHVYDEWISHHMGVPGNPLVKWATLLRDGSEGPDFTLYVPEEENPDAKFRISEFVPIVDMAPDNVINCAYLFNERTQLFLKRTGGKTELEPHQYSIERLFHQIVFFEDITGSIIEGCTDRNCFNPFHTIVHRRPVRRR